MSPCSKYEEKNCPRCQAPFDCKVGSIMLCQCSDIQLNYEELNYIGSLYDDCLCLKCMKELKAEYHNLRYQEKLKKILGVFYQLPKEN
ncbi:cysteine-rich CWC family protein [Elizabethkingia sp. JS20170427COW]|uniref:cysteine-rich CWC family protein n=1 Tax=Elizabethkingia sp. JS20170427COW TaxID=2583851 RepID=UPI001110C99A|nr:cysteine-rich CWC family protein [Elizabethkingia sp. JS20170427COW]QCX54123.1 cysteine-rich CWC family protein [Elizabethkingia sp. JS20170427COW]